MRVKTIDTSVIIPYLFLLWYGVFLFTYCYSIRMSFGMQSLNMSLDDMIKQDRKMSMKKNFQKRKIQSKATIRRIWTSSFKVEMPGSNARNFQRQQKFIRRGANQVRGFIVFWEDRECLYVPEFNDGRNGILMEIGNMTDLTVRKPKWLPHNLLASVCVLSGDKSSNSD